MRNTVLFVLMLSLTMSTAFAEPELKGTPAELSEYLTNVPKHITLSGKSERKTQADQAMVTIGVLTENSSLQTALISNQDLRTQVQGLLKKGGISEDKIKASRFSSTPQYGLFGKKPSSYKVENYVKITIANEKEFQEVAKIVDKFKEVEYKALDFEVSNKEKMEKEAVEQACEDVLKKKKIYEDKFGIKLLLKAFNEVDLNQISLDTPREGVGGSMRMMEKLSSSALNVSMSSHFGEVVFTGYITVDYIIEEK